MAVIRADVIVSPSVDTFTSDSALNSTTLEPGIYTLNMSKTILSQTCGRWTVIALSNNSGTTPVCYKQIWLPADTNLTGANQKMYTRTIDTAGTGFTAFTALVTSEELSSSAIKNQTSYPTEIYIQNTQPSTASGKNIIWIDTSS